MLVNDNTVKRSVSQEKKKLTEITNEGAYMHEKPVCRPSFLKTTQESRK